MKKDAFVMLVLGLALMLVPAVGAQTPDKDEAKRADNLAKLIKAKEVVMGPEKVALGDNNATIELPSGYLFINKERSRQILEKSGGSPENLYGIITPLLPKGAPDGEEFMVVCSFDDIGYVEDKDAGKLNADDILKNYKEGQAEQNERRKEENLEPFYVSGWAEPPRYEKGKHQVVWAINVKDIDTESSPVVTVNYNTRVLGRKGVLKLNLVTDPGYLAANKIKTAALLDKTSFVAGNRYEEYQPGKDKSSGLGLTGLILGGGALAAAAKLGVLGGLWKWALGILLVAKKFIIIIVVAAGAAISKFFKRDKGDGGTGGGGSGPDLHSKSRF